jgi:hypothetical protein
MTEWEWELYAAVLADIRPYPVDHRMKISTVLALLRATRGQTAILFNGENHPVNQIARAFMVDNGTWPKL